jgi:hypothetical protein
LAEGEKIIRELDKTRIIRSREEPHNILNEACIACHPKDKFDFWLLIYKGQEPRLTVDLPDAAPGKGTGEKPAVASAGPAAKPANPYNSHDAIGCNFCHLENPTKESPKFIVAVLDLCRLCHPHAGLHHLPKGEDLARVTAAIANGTLPGTEAGPVCPTCHQIHNSVYGTREAYARTIWEKKIPKPHGNRSLCTVCHKGTKEEVTAGKLAKGDDINGFCNECHTKVGIKRSPHVLDVGSSDTTWRMDYLGYPLKGGKLTCATCHDEICQGRTDPANPRFLRGGPYDHPDKFCYRCHLEDASVLNNPHNQLDGFGRIREASCQFCHKNPPDRNRQVPANLVMVGEENTVCGSCHEIRPHPSMDHLVRLSGEKRKRWEEYQQRHKVSLPLDDSGTIKCTTCHNPHAKGVAKGEAGVGAGSKWRVADFREMCAPCHGRY